MDLWREVPSQSLLVSVRPVNVDNLRSSQRVWVLEYFVEFNNRFST